MDLVGMEFSLKKKTKIIQYNAIHNPISVFFSSINGTMPMFNSSHFFLPSFTEFFLPFLSLFDHPSSFIFHCFFFFYFFFFATSPRSPPNTFHGVNTSNPPTPHPPPPSESFINLSKVFTGFYLVFFSFFLFFTPASTGYRVFLMEKR